MSPTADLFTHPDSITGRPLADRMRPQNLDEFFGQGHLLGPDKPLRQVLEQGQLHSMILWGPPGTGKTTLARMMSNTLDAQFINISAVLSGVKEIRGAIEAAKIARAEQDTRTVLFVDEVHRFNKSQQDAFLPFVENGTFVFIGATTENPSFELNNALLSRARVYVLKSLSALEIKQIIDRALNDTKRGIGDRRLEFAQDLRVLLAESADGDARCALNLLEIIGDLAEVADDGSQMVTEQLLKEVLIGSTRRFDKGGDVFYDQISALHKSVRGSNPDAALYWMARMLDGGCDALYIARRVVRMASEDIGNADPRALQLALNAWDVQQRLGSPEGELAIAQAVVFLACAAKSNAVYAAFNAAREDIKTSASIDVPLHLRNAPTQLMKDLNHGDGYRYAHNESDAYAAGENYFPEGLEDRIYYRPVNRGLETKIAERLAHLRKLDEQHNKQKP